jgi:hypothetical protein
MEYISTKRTMWMRGVYAVVEVGPAALDAADGRLRFFPPLASVADSDTDAAADEESAEAVAR